MPCDSFRFKATIPIQWLPWYPSGRRNAELTGCSAGVRAPSELADRVRGRTLEQTVRRPTHPPPRAVRGRLRPPLRTWPPKTHWAKFARLTSSVKLTDPEFGRRSLTEDLDFFGNLKKTLAFFYTYPCTLETPFFYPCTRRPFSTLPLIPCPPICIGGK